MRAVIQRVKSASVTVDGEVVSSIGPGLLCLIGIRETDTLTDLEFICKKILTVRAWPHPETNKAWDVNVTSAGLEILLVSQFTLYARLKKPKPDYSKAMGPQQAKELYSQLVEEVRRQYMAARVKDGIFGAKMDVALVNDGPVTYMLDSADRDG
ncbi:hypothetical protein VOLCADRAFT_96694 [Volvox carteri f. nagariensis]|uniref:D-aminoacyl-tRNA deacylase n=1 Tax=Volvox carteri f. nagariensis TaxID=3068 RepID=D8UAT6_VOLCA|nr:uncharacterized protein VOLCADRAFT_96694 [Volvox carteri f. nagariensis]EFJ43158.1 hypothetical protein VOLCADRAFT_96694 [Volvox carteri f. nagariensis]|eukprot:XP_002955733.1 hypothetical protein VOLCADRAFT_96694 [Volvox carteri f. nagariensis]